MKTFLKHIRNYTLILVGIASLSYGLNSFLFAKINPIVPKTKTMVSCGVSFSQMGLSDSIIPNFYNGSTKGKSGLGVYLSAKRILESNPHVETILTDASVLGLAVYRDYKFYLPVFAPQEFETCYPLTNFNDLKAYTLNPKYYLKSIMRRKFVPNAHYFQMAIERYLDSETLELPYMGQFSPEFENNPNASSGAMQKRLKQMQDLTGEEAPLSTVDVHYMDSIVQMIQEKDKSLVVFVSPFHQEFYKTLPFRYIELFDSYMKQLDALPQVYVVDFSKDNMPAEWFFNVNHLNYEGAQHVSSMLMDSLRIKGLNSSLNGI